MSGMSDRDAEMFAWIGKSLERTADALAKIGDEGLLLYAKPPDDESPAPPVNTDDTDDENARRSAASWKTKAILTEQHLDRAKGQLAALREAAADYREGTREDVPRNPYLIDVVLADTAAAAEAFTHAAQERGARWALLYVAEWYWARRDLVAGRPLRTEAGVCHEVSEWTRTQDAARICAAARGAPGDALPGAAGFASLSVYCEFPLPVLDGSKVVAHHAGCPIRELIERSSCSFCGSPAGYPCVTDGGARVVNHRVHVARRGR